MIRAGRERESGAALVTVLIATVLLGTACIGMLAAVGASARNNSDALNEAKAYYAAESGLQATINYLRHTSGMTYSTALAAQTAGTGLFAGPVTVGETSYTVQISDPDNAQASTTYTAAGGFALTTAGPYGAVVYYPNSTAADRTELSFVPPTGAPITFNHPDSAPFPELGSFRITKYGTGGTMTNILFRIDYQMIEPVVGTRSIRGTIVVNAGQPYVQYDKFTHTLNGGAIDLCSTSSCTVSGTAFANLAITSPVSGSADTPVYAKIAPLDPYRLKVLATGYGPNGAVKRLEGVIQKNVFNDSAGGPPIQAMGPGFDVQIGTSNNMEIQGGSSPSIGMCDSTGLANTNAEVTASNGTVSPPPAITCHEVPSYLTSPIALDAVVRQLRQSAINSSRYFTSSPNGSQGWGNFTTGTGLTFCDGNCTIGGNDAGGGILVVTGTLTTSGNPSFKGLVIVTGAGGIVRNGGGNELFIGNIVVAPYDPNALTSTWNMTPIYNQNGGPGDLINSTVAVDNAFNGTGAISNFMIGVAEK